MDEKSERRSGGGRAFGAGGCRGGAYREVAVSRSTHGFHFLSSSSSGGLAAVACVEALQAGIMLFGSALLVAYGE